MSRPASVRAEGPAEGGSRPRDRRRALGVAILAAALLAAGGALLVVAARGPAPRQSHQDRIRAVASTLRCPVCQDLSVADSPSALAGQMRAQIGAELRAGRTPDQIRQGFVASYGDWILLSPSRRGINLVAWLAPGALLALGLAAAGRAVRRWTARAQPDRSRRRTSELSGEDRELLEHALSALEDPEG